MKISALFASVIVALSSLMAAAAPSAAASRGEGDEEVRSRVADALHSDPYFYDAHVTVTVENGRVVLRGLVFSDWDIRDAIRIARGASGGRRVIDSLSMVQGGRR